MNKHEQIEYLLGWLHNHLLDQLVNPITYDGQLYKAIQERRGLIMGDQENYQMFYATYSEIYE